MCYLNQDIYAAKPWYLVIPVSPLIILRALLHAETCKGDSKVCLSHHHVYFIWNYNTVRVNSIHLVVQRMSKPTKGITKIWRRHFKEEGKYNLNKGGHEVKVAEVSVEQGRLTDREKCIL
jgi:hypothetical protein